MSSAPKLASSPDENAAGLTANVVNPCRYHDHILDPDSVAGIVAEMICEGARVLDVGCGSGSLGQILSEQCGANVVGIEPDPIRAGQARARGLEVYATELTEVLATEIGRFDVVLFTDVLEHLSNPHAELTKARTILKPTGAVILSVPNVAHWSVRLDILRGRFRYQPWGIMDATHLRWFTLETIKSLLQSAGFNPTKYRATAGLGLPDNNKKPLAWLAPKPREAFLRWGCRRWPALMGSQYVIKAEKQ